MPENERKWRKLNAQLLNLDFSIKGYSDDYENTVITFVIMCAPIFCLALQQCTSDAAENQGTCSCGRNDSDAFFRQRTLGACSRAG